MQVSALIFLIIGAAHVYRAMNGLPVSVGETHIANGLSWVAAALALYMAHQGYKHSKAR